MAFHDMPSHTHNTRMHAHMHAHTAVRPPPREPDIECFKGSKNHRLEFRKRRRSRRGGWGGGGEGDARGYSLGQQIYAYDVHAPPGHSRRVCSAPASIPVTQSHAHDHHNLMPMIPRSDGIRSWKNQGQHQHHQHPNQRQHQYPNQGQHQQYLNLTQGQDQHHQHALRRVLTYW